jgi:hypothetical protein
VQARHKEDTKYWLSGHLLHAELITETPASYCFGLWVTYSLAISASDSFSPSGSGTFPITAVIIFLAI